MADAFIRRDYHLYLREYSNWDTDMIRLTHAIGTLLLIGLVGCSASGNSAPSAVTGQTDETLSRAALVEYLSTDAMQGRLGGADSGARARAFLIAQLRLRGLDVAQQSFPFRNTKKQEVTGVNIIARIKGENTGPAIVVSAHYDHVGVIDEEVYNGASDNASGVAGAIAIADHFIKNPPKNTIIIALLDAEEPGLFGAKALLEQGLAGGEKIAFNLNLDMIAGYNIDTLYASGTYHNPQLLPLMSSLMEKAPIPLKLGYDRPEDGANDWTLLSDHGPFHAQGIPFVYLGVEDHKFYHKPGDTFDSLPLTFLDGAITTSVMLAQAIDDNLQIAATKPAK